MKTDFREYTLREFGKSATAIEVHLKQAAQDSEFCNDCIQKHFLEIQKFAEEGAGFFPEKKDWWENVETEAREEARKLTLVRKDQGRFNQQAKATAPWLRKRRKESVAMLEEEIDRQAALADQPMAELEGEKAYLVGHAGRRADLGAMDPDEMTEQQAHDFLMGLYESNLEGEKAYLVGHAGRRADLGCLFGCEHANLAGRPHGSLKAATAKAKKEGCTCMVLDEDTGSQICWAKGWVGALSKDQHQKLCTEKNTTVKKAKKTSGIGRVVDRFRKANQRCRENAKKSVREADPDRTVKVFAHYTGCMTKALTKGGKIPARVKKQAELEPTTTPKVAPSTEGPRGRRQISVAL